MHFELTHEQQLIIESARAFVEAGLYPYEQEVERSNQIRPELREQIRQRALEQGFFAANMPEELGGGGLDNLSMTLLDREQGVSFKLADMRAQLEAAELLTLRAAWKTDQGSATDSDYAMAKLFTTEMLARVADEAIQIHGGMGLMADLPLERIWRDARVERIWEGTSEIQRHIISRAMLRPLEQ